MGEYISRSVGISTKTNPQEAAVEAAEEAREGLDESPTVSFVFYAGEYDPEELHKGLMDTLDSEFVGGSADSVFYNDNFLEEGVVVLSLYSDYLHVGVASLDGASEDPRGAGKEVIENALDKVPVDQYIDPYLQFNRMKHTDVSWMIKIPSFFTFLFTRGLKLDEMGDEYDILKGIADVIGLQTPIWGGSFGVDTQKVQEQEPYEIYMFHNDQLYTDGIIAMVAVSSLLYSYSMEHGCEPTDTIGYISETSRDGFVVDEISGKPAVEWYAEQLGMDLDEFREDAHDLTQENPLGMPDTLGEYLIRGGGIPTEEGSLAYVAPFREGTPIVLMDGSEENLMQACGKIKENFGNYVGSDKTPELALVTQCVTRQFVYGDDTQEELENMRDELGCDIVGFDSFGETGSKQGQPANFSHVTLDVFALYDQMLSKLD